MEDKLQELISRLGEILTESALSVLPMLIPKPVDIKLGDIGEWRPQAYPEAMILITGSFTDGPQGSLYLLTNTRLGSIIADLMLGGEGAEDRAMDEAAKDAIKELINQIFGVAATTMREQFEAPMSFAQAEVHSLESGIDLNLLLGDEPQTRMELQLTIGDSEPGVLACCLPQETLESLEAHIEETKAAAAPEQEAVATAPSKAAAPAEAALKQPLAAVDAGRLPENVDLILDIELPVVIRLGCAEMSLQEVLRLSPGAIIELNKSVDEPVELLVNNKMIARGEVVVVEGNFAFRVTDIESKSKRIQSLA